MCQTKLVADKLLEFQFTGEPQNLRYKRYILVGFADIHTIANIQESRLMYYFCYHGMRNYFLYDSLFKRI